MDVLGQESFVSDTTVNQVALHFISGLDDTVKWFAEQMTPFYYATTTRAERVRHMELFHLMRRTKQTRMTMVDDGAAQKVYFVGRPTPDSLLSALKVLGDRDYHRLELHSTNDRSLAIYAFVYGEDEEPQDFDRKTFLQNLQAATCVGDNCLAPSVVEKYCMQVDQTYLARSNVDRVARHIRAWVALEDSEQVRVEIDKVTIDDQPQTRVLVASQMNRVRFVQRVAEYLEKHHMSLERGYLDVVPAFHGDGEMVISSLYLTNEELRPLKNHEQRGLRLALLGMRRQFNGVLHELERMLPWRQHHCALLFAAIDCAAQLLPYEHSYLDVRDVGYECLQEQQEICAEICTLFDQRFGPHHISERGWERKAHALEKNIKAITVGGQSVVLQQMWRFVAAVQATNLYRTDRLGQSFKLDPNILPAEHFTEKPYGLFYFHGRSGMGFQVRFRASARGGLRLVLPRSEAAFSRSRDYVLREVYDLAWAQQLKNKDIPEGGSKCIALIFPGESADAMVHQLADSLLDIILPDVDSVVGPHGADRPEELIFLGPDENMNPERIMWVADRARKRSLPNHLTLMSSKPGSGINHKEYGVTSEGVYCWINPILRSAGIDNGASWTLKMTGGPDGDVGGNLIKILHREQPERCKIVAIADGSGAGYDPDGFDWQELLRLVDEGLPIGQFNPSAIRGAGGFIRLADDAEGEQTRNNLHNDVVADVFVPCGGRPYTINERNWQSFLGPDGKPSSQVMVEAANIFISGEARRRLQSAGLWSIRDSSANKGGVICSSYEILAGLLIDEATFTQIKPQFVAEVVGKLQEYADAECEALLAGWRRRRGGVQLADLSIELSAEINRVADLLMAVVTRYHNDPKWLPVWHQVLQAHCPPSLYRAAQASGSDVWSQLPLAHAVAIVAKRLASGMVYHEGLTWCNNYVLADSAEEVLMSYLEADQRVKSLLATMDDPDQNLADALTVGVRRELVRQRLGR